MAINSTTSSFSLPQIDATNPSIRDNLGRDNAASVSTGLSEPAHEHGLAGDELMSINVWGAGSKMLVDQRVLSGQALSAQDIVNLMTVRS